jgi:hypothetical protein
MTEPNDRAPRAASDEAVSPNRTTYLDAAWMLLEESGGPLHYKDLTRLALERGLIEPKGLDPEATMRGQIYKENK